MLQETHPPSVPGVWDISPIKAFQMVWKAKSVVRTLACSILGNCKVPHQGLPEAVAGGEHGGLPSRNSPGYIRMLQLDNSNADSPSHVIESRLMSSPSDKTRLGSPSVTLIQPSRLPAASELPLPLLLHQDAPAGGAIGAFQEQWQAMHIIDSLGHLV